MSSCWLDLSSCNGNVSANLSLMCAHLCHLSVVFETMRTRLHFRSRTVSTPLHSSHTVPSRKQSCQAKAKPASKLQLKRRICGLRRKRDTDQVCVIRSCRRPSCCRSEFGYPREVSSGRKKTLALAARRRVFRACCRRQTRQPFVHCP